jgi:hypothetical protein
MLAQIFLAVLCLLAPCSMFGQVVNATLQGTVKDASGATIPGATVQAVDTSTGVVTHTVTNASGRFVFAALAPGGPYTITVKAPGFRIEDRSGIHLQVNQVADIAVSLQVGESAQRIEVNSDATQLETSSAALGQVIENRSVENLPLNQRNVWSLLFLMPGVTGSVTYQYNSMNMSVNGGRPGTTNLLVDGIPGSPPLIVPIGSLGIFPSVDSVQEFKVLTNGYSAEFGRSGSGIVNVILKSGTNQFHGSAFEFLRNSALDANTYFANQSGTPLPSFKRSQFGGSLSGPVIFPKLYNGKNKTFFLFSYEGLRQGTESETTTTVPTALQRTGDFSQTLAGVPVPAHMQGKSVLPLAKASDPSFRKEWYYEYYEWPNPESVRPHRGIRTERYKLIHYVMEPQEFELYDLAKDPGETQNLYGQPQHQSLQQDLLSRLERLRAEVPERTASETS